MDPAKAPLCQPDDTDAQILAFYRRQFRDAPLGRWATQWGGTMDPFEGLFFRPDGTGKYARQPGCDYEELTLRWRPVENRRIELVLDNPMDEEDEFDDSEPELWLPWEYDFEVRHSLIGVDVYMINTRPDEVCGPNGFRILDWPMFYCGGPDDREPPVRSSLWGGIRYFSKTEPTPAVAQKKWWQLWR